MVELEVIPACRHYGMGLIPWSPLGGGLLGGALEKQASGRRASDEPSRRSENRAKLEHYETLCRQLGEQPAAVALAWLLHNPVVTAPIIGPRTIEQLEARCGPRSSRLTRGPWRSSTRSSRVPAARRPRRTPGNPQSFGTEQTYGNESKFPTRIWKSPAWPWAAWAWGVVGPRTPS